jgi:hypothetical protein
VHCTPYGMKCSNYGCHNYKQRPWFVRANYGHRLREMLSALIEPVSLRRHQTRDSISIHPQIRPKRSKSCIWGKAKISWTLIEVFDGFLEQFCQSISGLCLVCLVEVLPIRPNPSMGLGSAEKVKFSLQSYPQLCFTVRRSLSFWPQFERRINVTIL